MTAEHTCSTVTVRPVDREEDAIVVHRAWLPMAVWESVRVRVRTSRGLTVMERFAMECLLELGDCEAHDLLEVASISKELGNWLLSSLTQHGLAKQIDASRFVPHRSNCEMALAERRIPVDHEDSRTFLWFPETEEFVCLAKAETLIRQLRDVQSLGQFPLTENTRVRKRKDVLKDALENNRVYGHDVDAICDVLEDRLIENDKCPAYYCSAILPQASNGGWVLTLKGEHTRRQRPDGTGPQAVDSANEWVECRFTLPVLPRLLKRWRQMLKSYREAIQKSCQELSLERIQFDGDVRQAALDAAAARRIAEQRLLSEHLALAVEINNEIEFAIPLLLSPSSRAAKKIFALDKAVQTLLASARASEVLQSLCDSHVVTPEAIRDRLWSLKLFGKLYEIREPEDFGE